MEFTLQSKTEMYRNFESATYREPGDPLNLTYPADHPLAAEFEEQMTTLVREYEGDDEYLSAHHPDIPGAPHDALDATALCLMVRLELATSCSQVVVKCLRIIRPN